MTRQYNFPKASKAFATMIIILSWYPVAFGQKQCLSEYREIPNHVSTSPTINLREEIVLPVVFHIVWKDSIQRINFSQIRTQLHSLNKDFQGLNPDLAEVPLEFRKYIGQVNFKFCLAAEDPEGNPTGGLTTTQTVIEHIGIHRDADNRRSICHENSGGADAWDPTRYINIWIGDMDGFLGYSSFPGQGPTDEDGIIIDPKYIGNNGLAFQDQRHNLGRTLTHEMGHYFNLQHIWGSESGECEEDDDIEDTPVQSGPVYGCPTHPQISCGHPIQFMNFLNYTDDACLLMFTQDQKLKMLEALDLYRRDLLDTPTDCIRDNVGPTWEVEIWPNPNSGQFTAWISTQKGGSFQVSILDFLGRKMDIGTWENGEMRGIDRPDLPAGLYLLQVIRNKQVSAYPFTIIHKE